MAYAFEGLYEGNVADSFQSCSIATQLSGYGFPNVDHFVHCQLGCCVVGHGLLYALQGERQGVGHGGLEVPQGVVDVEGDCLDVFWYLIGLKVCHK